MKREDFDGRPFVAGSVVGLRAFRIGPDGWLYGPIYPHRWTPAENTAKCQPIGRSFVLISHALRARLTLGAAVPAPEHSLSGLLCTCGFYAYLDGSQHSYADMPDGLAGIVEGYGTVTIGSRGFRASKARIVALVIPGRPRLPRRVWRLAAITAANAAFLPLNISTGQWWLVGLGVLGTVLGAAMLREHLARHRHAVARWDWPQRRHALMQVRERYPDVPVYASEAEALAAHPLTGVAA